MSKSARLISVAIGLLAVGIAIASVRPFSRYQRARCNETLKLLGNAIQTYQAEQQGRLPRQFSALSNELSNPAFLICPGSGHTPGNFSNADSWADYTLVDWPALLETNSVPTSYPIAYDRSLSNHGGRGVNVLTVDGFVRWDPNAERIKKFAAEHPNFKLSVPK
ncbi:MAG TPA: hypothetical protein P5233_19820 [Candidatus Paceibacterota bacterium]|nr:hypothetical protein [Candidatus Paceibacterota bacterium]